MSAPWMEFTSHCVGLWASGMTRASWQGSAALGMAWAACRVLPGLPPLTPLMILWINLVTNGLPALALTGFLDLALRFEPLGDQFPRHHGAEIGVVLVVDRGDEQVGDFWPDIDVGADGEIFGIAEDLALMCGVLVEDVDA